MDRNWQIVLEFFLYANPYSKKWWSNIKMHFLKRQRGSLTTYFSSLSLLSILSRLHISTLLTVYKIETYSHATHKKIIMKRVTASIAHLPTNLKQIIQICNKLYRLYRPSFKVWIDVMKLNKGMSDIRVILDFLISQQNLKPTKLFR